jgi:CheY-like chemotaxis protein
MTKNSQKTAPVGNLEKVSANTEKERPGRMAAFSSTLESLLNALSSLIKLAVIGILAIWIFSHQDFFEKWLWGLSGGEILGFKFTRESIDGATADLEFAIQQGINKYAFDNEALKGALIRASHVAPAIVNSRVLWVDDKPEGNAALVDVLKQKLKIIVVPVNSSAEALAAMQISPYDLIITNVWRPKDPQNLQLRLSACKVHYFDFPDERLAREYMDQVQNPVREVAKALALDRFNAEQNLHSQAGYSLADQIVSTPGTRESKPEIIFFSAVNAEVARPMCGYRITNRADVLLNSIVSILGERHADSLANKPWESEKRSEAGPKKAVTKN